MKKAESEGEKPKEKKKKKKKDGTVKEKKKDGTVKEKKKPKEEKEVRKSIKGEKTIRMSTSSFEVGQLSASPEVPKATVSKKHSILGLGLPSAMRLPQMRGGSTASFLSLNTQGQANPVLPSGAPGAVDSLPPSATVRSSKLDQIHASIVSWR